MSYSYESINNLLNADIENRNADSSINGYLYQFELTLYHMLLDGAVDDPFGDIREINQDYATYQIESVEDYIKYFSRDDMTHIRVAQIKYHCGNAGPKAYAEALIYLYYGYLKYGTLGISEGSTYKAFIFHHDKSNTARSKTKVVSEILDIGLRSIIDEYLRVKESKIRAEDDFSENQIFEFISEFDSERNRDGFAQIASFVWSPDRNQLINDIQEKLLDRYSDIDIYKGTSHKKDFYYALAISKLINDFRLKDEKYQPTSLNEFDQYFKSLNNWNIVDLLEIKLTDLTLEYLENVAYSDQEEVSEEFLRLIKDYEEICQIIVSFMKEKLSLPAFRESFFYTIIPKQMPIEYMINGYHEWEFFLENIQYVSNFIGKLAKMMYYFKKTVQETIDLDQWFEVNNKVWKLHYPLDTRKNGVIIGSISDSASPDKAIGEIKRKLLNTNTRVWYLCELCTRRNGRKHHYKHAIDSPDSSSMSIDKPSNQMFSIECMQCLGLQHYDDISEHVGNTFKEECTGAR